ncbi:uncharacterized protein EI90DRAFT_2475702 [Cantharellus anzutake]|uniref:uncharacterized protein n=1 Tax=Cantharellus anzutake TaxID=1750568 RepID=UPI00190587F2|nr:uncharacterized protein EI90DRAFT_2475702 [Cantharellus anzutake]KAF8322780.1 hypothetical protein EI90DRAFT_2475702 [Cantharellus anzutake]
MYGYVYIRMRVYTKHDIVPDERSLRDAFVRLLAQVYGTSRAMTPVDILFLGRPEYLYGCDQIQAFVRVHKDDAAIVIGALAAYSNAAKPSSSKEEGEGDYSSSEITGFSFIKRSAVLAELSTDLDAFKQTHERSHH